ncbi:MAG TPA: LemA family protein [Bacteroidia bacterium]|jgi:LemA protein|nr:LemA family protein [Bacteroidia bacterium]
MKQGTIVLLVILGFFLIIFFWVKGVYNGIVTKDETVTSQWGNVQTQYQQRMDLIPNLVSTVQGYANFEKSTLTAVIEARAKATSVTIDPTHMTQQNMQQFEAAQGQLTSSLSRLLVAVEQYPDLKANQNFLDLQAQLEGMEHRIATERRRFNEVVQDYNTYIRRFPQNIFAGMFNFQTRAYFQADEGASKAPKVDFNKQ